MRDKEKLKPKYRVEREADYFGGCSVWAVQSDDMEERAVCPKKKFAEKICRALNNTKSI